MNSRGSFAFGLGVSIKKKKKIVSPNRAPEKTSGHLFVRKNYNTPHLPGKSWSMIDRALQNGSQLFGAEAYSEDGDFFIKKGQSRVKANCLPVSQPFSHDRR